MMMRRIDLLPASHFERRRQRRTFSMVVASGLAVLMLLFGWWLMLGSQIAGAEDELAQVETRNRQLQTQIAELQRFAELENEVIAKEQALRTVMAGDIAWPSILTEVSMVLPGEVWLTGVQGSAGQTEGAAPVGTETAAIRVSNGEPHGRIQFQGASLSMPGVSKWLIGLAKTKVFGAAWLNSAQEAEVEGQTVYEFDSTIELKRRSLSKRFQEASQ